MERTRGECVGTRGRDRTGRHCSRVVFSDYPAPEVLGNIKANAVRNIDARRKDAQEGDIGEVTVEGHGGFLAIRFQRRMKALWKDIGRGLSVDAVAAWELVEEYRVVFEP